MHWENLTGANPAFVDALHRLIESSPYKDDIIPFSGKRSLKEQQVNWDRTPPSRRAKWVARPTPNAPHVKGIAADLGWRGGSFNSMPAEARRWLQANALREGLYFPMSYEPWHIQYKGDINGGSGGNLVGGLSSASPPGPGAGPGSEMFVAPKDTLMERPKMRSYDPLPQTSGHMDVVSASDHEALSPAFDQRRAVATSLRRGGGRPLFGGSDARIALDPGFRRLFGIGQDGGSDWTEFSPQEYRRLYQAGLLDASLREQTDYLYGKDVKRVSDKGVSDKGVSDRSGANIPDNYGDEIDRLARLDILDYEKERRELAEKWGVRLPSLDSAVASRRREINKKSPQGKPPQKVSPDGGNKKEVMLNNARRLLEEGTPRDQIDRVLRSQGIDPSEL